MMKKALITGLSGFTGKYLAAELKAAGYDVYGTGLTTHDEQNIHPLNLCDLDAVRSFLSQTSPSVVAHLAGISFVVHSNVEETYRTNIIGTRNLLHALSELKTPPKAVLLASSGNIYGNSSTDPIPETMPPSPENDYAISKIAMEHLASLWKSKLPLFIVRPFNYLGVGQSKNYVIPKIVDHFRRQEKEIELGNIDVYRDFSDVRTIAECYAKLIKLAPAGKTINICTGLSISIREILDIMAEIAGYNINVKTNPKFMRENEIKHLCGSNRLLTELIGQPRQIPLYETLNWMYQETKT